MFSSVRVRRFVLPSLCALALVLGVVGCRVHMKHKGPHTWMWNDARTMDLVTQNATHAGWTGLVSIREDDRYRVESIPMWRSDDLRSMHVVTFAYARRQGDEGLVYARVVDSRHQVLEPVVMVVSSGGNPGLGEELLTGTPIETRGEGIRVVSRKTRGELGETVYLFEKWSAAGNDTFLTRTPID